MSLRSETRLRGKIMQIRAAKPSELEEIIRIYSEAREFMAEEGNPGQWGDSYPSEALVLQDICDGTCRVVTDGDEILAVFYTAYGIEPAYDKIFGGEWGTAEPYGIIHRVAVASKARGRGVATFIFSEELKEHKSLRIDTHADNKPMQRALEKAGFIFRGTVYIDDTAGVSGEQIQRFARLAYDIG